MIGRLLGIGLVLATAAGAVSTQNVTQAFVEAYRTNPQLLAWRALLRATDEQVPQALVNWRSTVASTGQVGFTASAESLAQSRTVYIHGKPSSLDLSLTPQLYSGGPYRGADSAGDQHGRGDAGAEARGRDGGVPGGRPGLSRRRARSRLGRGQGQQRICALRRIRSDPDPRLGRQRCRAGALFVQLGGGAARDRRGPARDQPSQLHADRRQPPGRLLLSRDHAALPATREEALSLAAANNPNVISAGFTELVARDNIDVVRASCCRGSRQCAISIARPRRRSRAGSSPPTRRRRWRPSPR